MYKLGLELSKEASRNLLDKEFAQVQTYVDQQEVVSSVTGSDISEPVEYL
jgi:hypothetical protein